MLTAPLELNPAPANGKDVRPSLIFSFRGNPKWTFTTTSEHHLQISTYLTSGQLIFSNAHFNFGSSVPVKSLGCFGPAPPLFGKVNSGLFLTAPDVTEPGLLLTLRSLASSDVPSLVPGVGWLGTPALALDFLNLDSALLLRSTSRSGPLASASDPGSLGSASPPRGAF